MTDREKITEILKAYTKKHNIMASSVILEEYAEELVKQGVIVPPCKVGDTVYYIIDNTIQELKVSVVSVYENNYVVANADCLDEFDMCECVCDCIGKTCGLRVDYENLNNTVFLTKEEAERELEKRCNNAR